jgi:hypothetical protein
VSQTFLAVPQTTRPTQRISAVGDATVTSAAAVIDASTSSMVIAGGLSAAARPMADLFGMFMPLLKDVVSVADKVLALYQTAEHNKEICRFMVTRVLMAQGAIRPLMMAPPETTFFNEANYRNLQFLNSLMGEIFTFVKHVSQTRGITKLTKWVMRIHNRTRFSSCR